MAMVAAGFTGGQAEELRRALGFKRSERRMKQVEVQLREGMARQGIIGRGRRSDRPVDSIVCVVRISRIARGQLRAAGLRERVLESALSGRVLHGAPQQSADGVLPSLNAGERRAAPRRALSTNRCPGVRLGLHGGARRRDQTGLAIRERIATRGGEENRLRTSGVRLREGFRLQASGFRRDTVPQMRM